MSYTPPPPGAYYRPLPPALAPNGQPLASFLDRFLSYLIDSAIYTGVSLLWTIPFMMYWFVTFIERMNELTRDYGSYDPYDPGSRPPLLGADEVLQLYVPIFIFAGISVLLGLIFTYAYWVEYQGRRGGQTIGKRVMKIRVISVDPGVTVLGRGVYAKRWAVQYVVGSVIPLFSLIDGLWQLSDKPLQQCLHDKAANTVVVKVG